MKKGLHLSLFISALAATRVATAHPHDFEGWLNTNAHIAIDEDKRYQFYVEGQPRQGNDFKRSATSQGWVALHYTNSKAVGLYVGYAWTPSFYDSHYHRDYRDEQRIWQQIIYRHELFGMKWQHRLRQEQRMITRTDEVSNRTRYMLKGSYALSEDGNFGLTGYDEFMVNLNGVQNGPWAGYDRNRIFFGPYWQKGPGRYEVGYLGEHLKRFGSDERWAHVIAINAAYNF
jgi:hypothetical protein